MTTIPHDKLLHFAAGSVAALGGLGLALYLSLPVFEWSVGVAVAAACGKEFIDTLRHGSPSAGDLIATLAGAVPVWVALGVS